jgi:hypothetical protein
MTVAAILKQLKSLGNEGTKRVLTRHGAREPFFGVKIEFLKRLQKELGRDQRLAISLYRTGNSDAMYLAGLIADPEKMSPADLQRWADAAYWTLLQGIVAGVAAEGPHGWEMGLKWIDSPDEPLACTGWATLAACVSVKPDDELPIKAIEKLLARVAKQIHKAPNKVRYEMNAFLIAVGCFIEALHEKALARAIEIGRVDVDMGQTSCSVPDASAYILKVRKMGRVGRKRPHAIC